MMKGVRPASVFLFTMAFGAANIFVHAVESGEVDVPLEIHTVEKYIDMGT